MNEKMTLEELKQVADGTANDFVDYLKSTCDTTGKYMTGGQLLLVGYSVIAVIAKALDTDPDLVCLIMASKLKFTETKNDYHVEMPADFMGED
ncbi:hypothetical protein [Limosilactobacillus mucosae]|uniref:hypothetical protein n=1 Tax=Limosilactobacillus mucosae TaxID=97478 RepID=UPI001F579367|nr:hypothetical protein [Limosilactobacillus mucosae]UNL61947.1 hypothetical protein G8B17_06660 [Limosilactobacillus mucosae]